MTDQKRKAMLANGYRAFVFTASDGAAVELLAPAEDIARRKYRELHGAGAVAVEDVTDKGAKGE